MFLVIAGPKLYQVAVEKYTTQVKINHAEAWQSSEL